MDMSSDDDREQKLIGSALTGFTDALRNALRAEKRAAAEAEMWQDKARRLQESYDKQEDLVRLLRSQVNPMSQARSCTLPDTVEPHRPRTSLDLGPTASRSPDQPQYFPLDPAAATPSSTSAALNAGAHSAYLSRNTIAAKPELSRLDEHVPATLKQLRTGVWESDPGESPFSNSQAMRQQDMTSKQKSALASKALRFAQQHASAPVSAQATLGSLASMLMACSVLQPGGCITVQGAEGVLGASRSANEGNGDDGDEQSRVSVDDDGASGVGAAAAAAVSVAVARSWTSAAHKSQGNLEQLANGSVKMSRAGFRLTAVRRHAAAHSPLAAALSPTSSSSPGSPSALDAIESMVTDGDLASTSGTKAVDENGLLQQQQSRVGSYIAVPRHPGQSSSPFKQSGALPSGRSFGQLSAQMRGSDSSNDVAAQVPNLGATLKLQWLSRPGTVLVVAKPTPRVHDVLCRVVLWLLRRKILVFLEPQVHERRGAALEEAASKFDASNGLRRGGGSTLQSWSADAAEEEGIPSHHVPSTVSQRLDLIITLGGDGTVLWTGGLLGTGPAPPLVSFALGSLGFMTPFPLKCMPSVLESVLKGDFSLMLRHRLHCTIVRRSGGGCGEGDNENSGHSSNKDSSADETAVKCSDALEHEVLNEAVLDRGVSPFLTSLDCYCDGHFVTNVQGDGLIIATPTGSTAYNLAAGGSMVHPEVPAILFAPICSHSLTQRPLLFPDTAQLRIQVPEDGRSDIFCSFDGKVRQRLCPGDAVVITTSRWPMPMVCNVDASHDWLDRLTTGLSYNSRQQQAGADQ